MIKSLRKLRSIDENTSKSTANNSKRTAIQFQERIQLYTSAHATRIAREADLFSILCTQLTENFSWLSRTDH